MNTLEYTIQDRKLVTMKKKKPKKLRLKSLVLALGLATAMNACSQNYESQYNPIPQGKVDFSTLESLTTTPEPMYAKTPITTNYK